MGKWVCVCGVSSLTPLPFTSDVCMETVGEVGGRHGTFGQEAIFGSITTQSTDPFSCLPFSLDSGGMIPRGGALRFSGAAVLSSSPLRSVKAAPLSLLSWSLDASEHSHHSYRRRFGFTKRLPHIVRCIAESQPDVVALQDSSVEACEALEAYAPPSEGGDGCRYRCIGRAVNGRCGEVQLMVKISSCWKAEALNRGPGVVARLSCGMDSLVVCNIDLSYRGRSLGRDGELIASPADSLSGSPFSFGKEARKASRDRGDALDPFRRISLQHVKNVVSPDILVGNFYMSRNERLQGYRDAWVLAGSPADHERTTNTHSTHSVDKVTNFHYFTYFQHQQSAAPEVQVSSYVAGSAVHVPLSMDSYTSEAPTESGGDANNRVSSFGWMIPEAKSNSHSNSSSTPASGSTSLSAGDGVYREVAGRYQRCFLSAYRPSSPPVVKRYTSVRTIVPRPQIAFQDNSGHPITCAPSDQYPLLVLLTS